MALGMRKDFYVTGYFREIASAVDIGLLRFEVLYWIDFGQIESVIAEALKVSLAVIILAIDPLERVGKLRSVR